jgi:hypothetical protein
MGVTVLCFGVVVTAVICLLVVQYMDVRCLVILMLLHVIKNAENGLFQA